MFRRSPGTMSSVPVAGQTRVPVLWSVVGADERCPRSVVVSSAGGVASEPPVVGRRARGSRFRRAGRPRRARGRCQRRDRGSGLATARTGQTQNCNNREQSRPRRSPYEEASRADCNDVIVLLHRPASHTALPTTYCRRMPNLRRAKTCSDITHPWRDHDPCHVPVTSTTWCRRRYEPGRSRPL